MDRPSFRLDDIKLEDLGKNIDPKVLAEGTVGTEYVVRTDETFFRPDSGCDLSCDFYNPDCDCEEYGCPCVYNY